MPSTMRVTTAECALINRNARLTIASNTGCASAGERLMTFRIAAEAACCSRASARSFPITALFALSRASASRSRFTCGEFPALVVLAIANERCSKPGERVPENPGTTLLSGGYRNPGYVPVPPGIERCAQDALGQVDDEKHKQQPVDCEVER